MNLSLIRARQAQRGSTFLGIILGVVVGLAAALGVAIYVAKVPVPFVNKNTFVNKFLSVSNKIRCH